MLWMCDTKTVSIMHKSFQYCWVAIAQYWRFFVSHVALPMSRFRVWKKLGEDRARTADLNDQMDVHTTWHHAEQ